MNTLIKFIAGVVIAAGAIPATAHDFTATVEGQTLYFNIVNKKERKVAVTFCGSISDHVPSVVRGTLVIPTTVKDGTVPYTVTAVGPKAFANSADLEGVVFPTTVTSIGDFAFEGCNRLSKVIFPGRQVEMGQGTFFRCTSLSQLTFGSDWRVLDLAPYRWSDSLRTLVVPAKIERVQNLKSLRSLRSIEVDANNRRFSSHGGALYNKDGKTLYGVPRAYAGPLTIADGTTTVTEGAFVDCPGITQIVFPASLQSLSFRETANLLNLETLVMKGAEPVLNAIRGGKSYFLVELANPKARIVISKDAKKAYREALATEPGEYTQAGASTPVPYAVPKQLMPTDKTFETVKNFAKYE